MCNFSNAINVLQTLNIRLEHNIDFVYCNCEPLAIALVRCQLWPATPHSPRLVFMFTLLDLFEALMLECHVALRDFCNALYFLCPNPASIVNVSALTNTSILLTKH